MSKLQEELENSHEDEIITTVEYIYLKGDDVLFISFEYGTEDADIMVVGEEYVSPDTGQTMYVEEGIKIIESIKEVAD